MLYREIIESLSGIVVLLHCCRIPSSSFPFFSIGYFFVCVADHIGHFANKVLALAILCVRGCVNNFLCFLMNLCFYLCISNSVCARVSDSV